MPFQGFQVLRIIIIMQNNWVSSNNTVFFFSIRQSHRGEGGSFAHVMNMRKKSANDRQRRYERLSGQIAVKRFTR